MSDIKDLDIEALLPDSISEDKKAKAIAEAVTNQLLEINRNINQILIWDDISKHDDNTLLNLAWQMHTDIYDTSFGKQTRVNLINDSVNWHKVRGTPYAVRRALYNVYSSGYVEEWYEYGGEPYHFRVAGISDALNNDDDLKKLEMLIASSKNCRSWIDGIDFTRTISSTVYVGGAVLEEYKEDITSTIPEENGKYIAYFSINAEGNIAVSDSESQDHIDIWDNDNDGNLIQSDRTTGSRHWGIDRDGNYTLKEE